jgi:hypothetical protein
MTDDSNSDALTQQAADDWSPESDPDGITPQDVVAKDWALELFMNMVLGANDDGDGHVTLTVQSNGATISGTLIGASAFIDKFTRSIEQPGAREFAEGYGAAFEELSAETSEILAERARQKLPQPARRYLHMRDVSIFAGSQILHAPCWRGSIADVTGWSLGVYGREDADE